MSKLILKEVMNKVKENSANHPKYIKRLMNLYNKSTLEEFVEDFMRVLEQMFVILDDRHPQLKRTMLFCSQFCAEVTRKEDDQDITSNFLNAIMEKVLQYTDNLRVEVRNNSCMFIKLLLQDLGNDVNLDAELCDDIQETMLKRIQDPKVSIRLQAISTLPRLQDPYNIDCPVIKAYLSAINDPNNNVRCRVTKVIAVNMLTLNKIRDRVRDVDYTVRMAAFQRCADINPKHFKIVDRHNILLSGFAEQHEATKAAFVNGLLAKWVTAYEGDYLAFIRGLKLSSTDDDMSTMVYITNCLLAVFHDKYSLNDLIDVVPISKTEKLVPFKDLTNDVALYWNVLTNLLRRGDEEDYLDALLPELTPLCHYIEKYVETKVAEKLDEWAYLDFQFNLVQIFEIVQKYDFSDEVGRRTLRALVMGMIQKYEFTDKFLTILMTIASQCSLSIDVFTNDVCEIISEIREPMVEVEAEAPPISEQQLHQNKFKMAQLNVKLNMLDMEEEQAVNNKDYKKAQQVASQMEELRRQMDELREQQGTTKKTSKPSNKVRTVKTDVKTVCRCLDLVAAMLQVVAVNKMTPSLNSCKDEFVMPLIATVEDEVHWRVLKCLALFSIIDKPTAEKYSRVLSIPLATYRTTANYNVPAMVTSVSAMSDLIRVYGSDVIVSDKTNDTTSATNAAKRRLYNHEDDEDHLSPNRIIDNMTLADIYQILLDMLDGDCEEICQTAIDALWRMVLGGFPVNSSFISRILLKWYNPLTKKETLLQTKLGHFIQAYVNMPSTRDIFVGSAIPTIYSLANAPRTSPLSDVDIDNVISFYSQLIEADDARILALDLCMKIAEDVDDKVVVYLARLLNQLKLVTTTLETTTELLQRAEQLLQDVTNKTTKKHIEKFALNLREKERIFRERPSQSVAAVEATTENDSNVANGATLPTRNSSNRFSGLPAAESTRVRITSSTGMDDENQAKRQKRISKIELPCRVFLPRALESEHQLDVIDETSLESESSNISEKNSENSRRSSVSCEKHVITNADSSESSGSKSKDVKVQKRRSERISKIELPCKVILPTAPLCKNDKGKITKTKLDDNIIDESSLESGKSSKSEEVARKSRQSLVERNHVISDTDSSKSNNGSKGAQSPRRLSDRISKINLPCKVILPSAPLCKNDKGKIPKTKLDDNIIDESSLESEKSSKSEEVTRKSRRSLVERNHVISDTDSSKSNGSKGAQGPRRLSDRISKINLPCKVILPQAALSSNGKERKTKAKMGYNIDDISLQSGSLNKNEKIIENLCRSSKNRKHVITSDTESSKSSGSKGVDVQRRRSDRLSKTDLPRTPLHKINKRKQITAKAADITDLTRMETESLQTHEISLSSVTTRSSSVNGKHSISDTDTDSSKDNKNAKRNNGRRRKKKRRSY